MGDLRKQQPHVVCNDRTDAPGDRRSREGDHALGAFDSTTPWEPRTTLAGTWGYQKNARVKPLDDCIRPLVGTVGRDGNLLLNVGPRPDGTIEPDQVQRLAEIGDRLGKHGESIDATRGGPFPPGDFGVSTCRDRTVLVHVLKPGMTTIALPDLPAEVVKCACLTGGTSDCRNVDGELQLTLAGNAPAVDTIVALTLDKPVVQIKAVQ